MTCLSITRSLVATLCISATLGWAQSDPAKDKAVYAGTVVDSVTHLPVAKATVRLNGQLMGKPGYAATAAADGSFRLEGVEPGDYLTEIRARAFVTSEGNSVHFSPGQSLEKLELPLDPEAILTGKVLDPDGDPAPDAQVYAVVEEWNLGMRRYQAHAAVHADERGVYRMKLPPGRYYLEAVPSGSSPHVFTDEPGHSETKLVPVFQPNVLRVTSAAQLEVTPGRQLTGLDFKLRTVTAFHVRGIVKPYPAPAPQQAYIMLRTRDGDVTPSAGGGALVNKDGSFDIAGVLPGSYWLYLMPIRNSPTGRIAIEVSDRDVDGVRFPAVMPFELKGRVRIEGEAAPQRLSGPGLHISMMDAHPFPFRFMPSLDGDGAFRLQGVPAAVFAVSFMPVKDLFIQSIIYNRQMVEGGMIDFTNGAAGDVEIVLTTGTAQVDGTVRWPESTPGAPPPTRPKLTAVLVSADGRSGNTEARAAVVDPSGKFQFHFVPPGRYYVGAIPQFDSHLWQNMEFVRQLSPRLKLVELAKKDSVQVEAPILDSLDIQRALDELPR